MVHVIQQVLFNASSIGEMLKDPNELPDGVTMEELESFLQDVIDEQDTAYDLKHANWEEVQKEIHDYFDVKMTNEKRKLVAEESAEAAAEIVAGAAAIVATAFDLIPFVNFALEAEAMAAIAVQTGLEYAVEKLQGTIVEDLANADTNIANEPGFAKIKPYSQAVKRNTSMFPRLQIGGKTSDIRAMFLSFVVAAKKLNNKGEVTVASLKKQFIDLWDATNDPDLGPIMAEYTLIHSKIDDNIALGATPPDSAAIANDVDPLLAEVPAAAQHAFASAMMMFMGIITTRHGKQVYSLWKAGKNVLTANRIALQKLNAENKAAGAEEVGDSGVAAEVGTLETMDYCVKGIGALAAVATVVFAGLEIKTAIDTEKNLTDAFNNSKKAITDYYRQICGVPNENIPDAPFQVGLTPVEAGTEDDWGKAILGQANWKSSFGTLNTSEQCMESVKEDGADHLWSVIMEGPINAVQTISYICLSGVAAQYVDVAFYPAGKYLGWNGSTFTSNPAIAVDGNYWYKLEVDLNAPFADKSSVFVAKTYRAPKSLKSGNFKIWAFSQAENNGVPDEVMLKAPSSVDLTPIEASTKDDWAKAILGQDDWKVDRGTFNTFEQCMESEKESPLWVVITSGAINAVKKTSYICVSGDAAQYVDVAVYPAGKYLGWNGSTFTSDPATNEGGYYWYKLEIDLDAPFADSSSVFYAKTYRAPKSMKSGDFKIWAFDEMPSNAQK